MCDKKFIKFSVPVIGQVSAIYEQPSTFYGFFADSSFWISPDDYEIKLLGFYGNGKPFETNAAFSYFISQLRNAILQEIEKHFPKPVPKKEIGLTVEQIGKIIKKYTKRWPGTPCEFLIGDDEYTIRRILNEMNLKPLD